MISTITINDRIPEHISNNLGKYAGFFKVSSDADQKRPSLIRAGAATIGNTARAGAIGGGALGGYILGNYLQESMFGTQDNPHESEKRRTTRSVLPILMTLGGAYAGHRATRALKGLNPQN